jgi:hypothetical protein
MVLGKSYFPFSSVFPLSVLPSPVPFFSTGGTLPGEPFPAPSLGTARLQAALRRAAAPDGGARELQRWRVGAAQEAAGELARVLAREPGSGRQRERAEAQRERAAGAGAGASGRRRGSARARRQAREQRRLGSSQACGSAGVRAARAGAGKRAREAWWRAGDRLAALGSA